MRNDSYRAVTANPSIVPLQDFSGERRAEVDVPVKKHRKKTRWIWLVCVIALLLLTIGILIFVLTRAQSHRSSSVLSREKVLLIIADGIPADVIENASIPHLKAIGQYKRAYVGGENGSYSETPTISAPGYMDIITGTWGNKHNVHDNYVNETNYHYRNLFRLVKEEQPEKKIAIFSTWTDNRLKLVGEGLSTAGNIKFDYAFDGYELDEVAYPHNSSEYYIRRIDQRVVNETARCIEKDAPDLSWVYLQYTDDVGHVYGDSPQMYQSIENLDRQIGQIYEAIRYRRKHFEEEWLVIVTTDHGRDPRTGQDHGEQSERERTTWLITDANQTNGYFQDFTPAAVDLLPTMARFLNVKIPTDVLRELDGVPLLGKVSLIEPHVSLSNQTLSIRWKALDPQGNVTIRLATTNLFRSGLKDDYQWMGSVPLEKQMAQFPIPNPTAKYYKIILEGHYNTVNRWLILS